MLIKTSELSGAALDWAVAQAELTREDYRDRGLLVHRIGYGQPMPAYSTSWAQGGPIIEREGIELICNLTATEAARFEAASANWQAFYRDARSVEARSFATTPLVAAMKAFVRRKLGDTIDIPEALT